jgi:hypothetical protein
VAATRRRGWREFGHPPNPPPVPARGWGLELQRARLATGLHVFGVADRLKIGSFAFGSMLDDLESLPEAPETPRGRRRAAYIMLGFGLDPGQHGISLDEFTPEHVRFMRETTAATSRQPVPEGDSAGEPGGQPAPVVLHNWIVNGIIALPYLLFLLAPGLLMVGTLALPGLFLSDADQHLSTEVQEWVPVVAWVTFSAVLCGRALTRGVVASPAGLRVQRVFRTREVAWRDIERFSVRVDAHEDQMTWYSCVVEGRGLDLERDLPIASGSPNKAQGFVERLNASLAEHRSQA